MAENSDNIFDPLTGKFLIDKIDVNEITQYALIKAALEHKNNVIGRILPSEILQDLQENNISYEFPEIYHIDSSLETNSESTNEVMNYFLSRKYSEKLLKLNSKDISSLLSYVKLLRVPKENNKPKFENATEISFSTHYSKNSLERILQDSTSVGLKSLTADVISNTGAYYNYQISMNLFFANANVLMNNIDYKLLLKSPTKDINKEPVVYCLIFGWANPNSGLSSDNIDDLYEEQVCLLLGLRNYDLQFSMDGSVSLTVNFIGSAENQYLGIPADVLVNKNAIENLTREINQDIAETVESKKTNEEELKKQQESIQAQINQRKDALKNEGKDISLIESDETIKALNYALENNTKRKEIEQLISNDQYRIDELNKRILNLKYSSFMERMFEFNAVYYGAVEFYLLDDKAGTNLTFAPYSIGRGYTTTSALDPEQKTTVSTLGIVNTVYPETLRKRIDQITRIEKERKDEISDREKEIINAFTDMSLVNSFNAVEGKYALTRFSYMLAGDIIGIAASNAYINFSTDYYDITPQDIFKIVLGSIDILKTTTIKKGRELETQEEIVTLDLASFPVAYNVFVGWFLKRVVEAGVETYNFNDFVKDFLNDCVLNSIEQYSVWEKKFKGRTLELNTKTEIIRAYSDEAIEIFYTDLPYNIEELFDSKNIKPSLVKEFFKSEEKRRKISPFTRFGRPSKDTRKYAFIYGKFGKLKRSGNYKDNLDSGIFHFYVGSTTGILKDIKFTPITMPQRGAAQILSADRETSGTPLDEKFNLIQRYDANISCFGVQYFKPGQLIFIDTSLVGFGKPSDLNSPARAFTLGGYYLITKVSHNIESNDFTTSITAKFHDYGT